ncbi:hypothetical protein QX233_11035 [Chryseobacterium gambrini]|uniref:Lipoprotein n=1 Tax=Chryseobacterium gambrini TaxID=373672 RepID=A0AAJ1R7K7_9FLAO|nr:MULTISPECIES: hypothetical protein [Chryseobacterium]MDN4012998.1 hypothetical protein [Chryseobacterium gambrini]MDN4030725.1 hypothetical protein [Chryseobacterium gambrini]QWA38669.1 hypothetical protein KKI44_00180 [Chryseobacterium sp. ZHDP1]
MKNILVIAVLLILSACNKNPEISEVIGQKKIIAEIDKFIEDSNAKKKVKFIIVSGFENSEKKQLDLLFTNQKPTIINDNSPRVNDEIKSQKYGYFKYKDYEFLVSQKLESIFKLKYEDFDHMKEHFTVKEHSFTKEEAMKKKWRTMYVRYNEAKDSIELSNISELSLPDYSR